MELEYHYFEEVDSTNTRLKEAAANGAPEGTVYCAGRQTAGRGRSGHDWESPQDESVATSLLLYPDGLSDEETALLTPLAALAVCDAIEGRYGLVTQIKWVNDVLVNEKKISGILTERVLTEDGRRAVVIGIGINVGQRTFPTALSEIATSVAIEMEGVEGRTIAWKESEGEREGQEPEGELTERREQLEGERAERREPERERAERRELTEDVWREFLRYYETFVGKRTLGFVRGKYNAKLVNRGRRCVVCDPEGAYEGEAIGIDGNGRLLIRTDEGDERAIDSGEVSVRGIYGYV